jgi:TorA maturation chaperone TorD
MAGIKKIHRVRSYIYNFLATLFRDGISQGLFENLRGEVFLQNLNEFVDRCPLADLRAAWRKMLAALEQAGPQDGAALRLEYADSFLNGGTNPVFPYASRYLSNHSSVRSAAAEVRQFYRRARVHKSPAYDQPGDHLAVELEFMRLLSDRVAAAADGASELAQLQNAFRQDHLMQWAPQFCAVLNSRAQSRFYRALAEVTAVTLFHDQALAMEPQAPRVEALAMLAQTLVALDLSHDLFTLAPGLIPPPGAGETGRPGPRKRPHS